MLKSLSIENYALINSLEISLNKGFSIITGETGAGKTILLGALSLILGQRSDTGMLKDKSKKCIVEGVFQIENSQYGDFFSEHELDFDHLTILRREILPEGKSRAFINDTPVNLALLKELGTRLVDIHSQHENLLLTEKQFQIKVVDTIANHQELLEQYKNKYLLLKDLSRQYDSMLEKSQKAKSDLDYLQFQFSQLNDAKLNDENEQQYLESEYQTLTHAEEIKSSLHQAEQILNNDESSVIAQIRKIRNLITQVRSYFTKADEFLQRFESSSVELKDLASEISLLNQSIEHDPATIKNISERLNLIYSLQQKHHVSTLAQLIEIRENLGKEIFTITNYDTDIDQLKIQINNSINKLQDLSVKISRNRKKAIPTIEKTVCGLLIHMGMPHAKFSVNIRPAEEYMINGKDIIDFLFSANRNIEQQEISKVASGGEFSRLMLSIKTLLSRRGDMPTIIFDEIDIGVSGEIADKVGNILQEMSKSVQLINVTHLPQIAAKADYHFLIYKTEDDMTTATHIRQLNTSEQVIEIAKMLSGNELTNAAILNAKELLKN
jgi:DNA repair protein RecN (Recombination protein N)